MNVWAEGRGAAGTRGWALTLAWLALACPGCDRLFPFDSGRDAGVEPSRDQSRDLPGPGQDRGLTDGPTAIDSSGTEGPIPEDASLMADAVIAADGPPVTQDSSTIPADGPPLIQDSFISPMDMCVLAQPPGAATACIDTESANSNGCPGACALVNDTDCDGLKDGPGYEQDPWPNSRNLLFLGDGFLTAIDAPVPRWTAVPGLPTTAQDLVAGTVTLPHNVAFDPAPVCESAITDMSFMVETRIVLSAKAESLSDWRFEVRVMEGDLVKYRDCGLIRVLGEPELQLQLAVFDGATVNPGPVLTGVLPVQDATYLLQTWAYGGSSNPTHVCRLLDGTGSTELLRQEAPATVPMATSSFRLSPFKAEAIVDYVRVYDF